MGHSSYSNLPHFYFGGNYSLNSSMNSLGNFSAQISFTKSIQINYNSDS